MPWPPLLLLVVYAVCLLLILAFGLGQWHLTRLARLMVPILPPPAPTSWPRVTVQLPLYNERNVAARIIDAAVALDYPVELLHIQVLDDSTDASWAVAAACVAHHRTAGHHIDLIHRTDRQGFKAGALKHGLAHTDGEFIAIFDADFVPAPDFLRRTLPHFQTPETGVVQTRWGHLNADESLLTRLQAFGLDAHFLIEQVGRGAGGHFINFNGTGGVWRRTCIEDAGNWQADTLTEDLDLSYRAQLRGWHFAYVPTIVAPAELPATIAALQSQQFRWTKGAAETARKHLRAVWHSNISVATKLTASIHLLNSSVYVIILLMALLSVPLLFVRVHYPALGSVYHLGALVVLAFAPLVFFYYSAWQLAQKPAGHRPFFGDFLLFLAVSMGLAAHNARAVLLGWWGRPTAFIRTPKVGSAPVGAHRYPASQPRGLVLQEVLLLSYFLGGVVVGIWLKDYGLLPFHLLLVVGLSIICYYSLRRP